ncbi:hypothetical protein [Psychrobacter sp. NPDC078929]|jgi:hypothetical protein|uniref:hypothetical protein n=1 Tax=unclassified Psychrobacter TaxID=196806 RepID=UPI003CFE53DF|tara:strand:- start:213 stop:452 length:240 start_codon:yes stop_codon:yes gene_type:complete
MNYFFFGEKSMYWVGYRVIALDGSNPGSKCLLGPFNSYESAKKEKSKNRARDMEQTAIFKADSEEKAELLLKTEQFSRL